MGIKPENLSLLFKEFGKVNDDENKMINPAGIGLGLMISNELSKLLSYEKKKRNISLIRIWKRIKIFI